MQITLMFMWKEVVRVKSILRWLYWRKFWRDIRNKSQVISVTIQSSNTHLMVDGKLLM